jgi:hypothetical protein
MDDIRFHWLRDRIYEGLDINEHEVFEEFLQREDGDNEMKIAKFINQTDDDDDFAILFNKHCMEEEIEVEIELSKYPVFFERVFN